MSLYSSSLIFSIFRKELKTINGNSPKYGLGILTFTRYPLTPFLSLFFSCCYVFLLTKAETKMRYNGY